MFSLVILGNMFILFFFSIVALQAACPSGWLAWQDSCYIFFQGELNRTQAEEACKQLGANMVVPNSQTEQDFVWLKFQTHVDMLVIDYKGRNLWIGCKTTAGGTLECFGVDGNPALYTNFMPHEPISSDECVRMSSRNQGAWESRDCKNAIFAACEMEVPCSRAAMKFNLVPHSCLINHQIKNYPVKESIGCGLACWAEPLCRSFNLLQQAGDSKICQLNNATLLDADDASVIKNAENCFFYE